jgi:hypothetical protein
MSVWGALFELDPEDFKTLDRKEGHPEAYVRAPVTVRAPDGEPREAVMYVVADKETSEVAPSAAYMASVLDGALAVDLPPTYKNFLRWLDSQREAERFRDGLVVHKTRDRSESRGCPLVVVPQSVAGRERLGEYCAVRFGKAMAIARTVRDPRLPSDVCEVDQHLRTALGFGGQDTYGHTITVHPLKRTNIRGGLMSPRTLVLPRRNPAWVDGERGICVLHPRTISLLGLAEGQHATLACVVPDADEFRVRKASFRVYCGTVGKVREGSPTEEDYPLPTKVYLDADGVRRLGIPDGGRNYPILIYADVVRLLAGRTLFYGVTFLLGIQAILEILRGLNALSAYQEWVQTCVALVAATVLTLAVAFVDIRGKVES